VRLTPSLGKSLCFWIIFKKLLFFNTWIYYFYLFYSFRAESVRWEFNGRFIDTNFRHVIPQVTIHSLNKKILQNLFPVYFPNKSASFGLPGPSWLFSVIQVFWACYGHFQRKMTTKKVLFDKYFQFFVNVTQRYRLHLPLSKSYIRWVTPVQHAMAYFFIWCIFLGGLECVGHSFAYVVHFVFSRDVWIRTPRELPWQAGALPI
jgi:hypothetical protein